MSDNLFSWLHQQFQPRLDRSFIAGPPGSELTYAEVMARSGQIANCLVACGVTPGDRVAVQLDKSVENVLLYLAVLRVGGVYLPLNPAYTLLEVEYFLADAEPRLLVCRPQDEAAMRQLPASAGIGAVLTLGTSGMGSLLTAAADHPAEFRDVPRSADDLAAILYTSGTTGRSKGAMLSHGNLQSNCATLREAWRFSPDDCLLHALPIFHTHGLFVAINLVLASGAAMIFLPRFDAGEVIGHLPDATVMMGVPTFYTRLLEHDAFDAAAAAGMRLFVSGSAPLGMDTSDLFERRTGHRILERYGMTETNMNTSNPYEGPRIPGSVGRPLPGVELRIADPQPRADSASPVGVIEVRGPNVFAGYWRMPEKTAEEFREDGYFITGDMGYIDDDGYVFIVGRAKDLIIAGGLNIYPAEVEQALEALPEVAESAVIGVPHADLGEAVLAVVTLTPGSAADERALLAALAPRLARFKQPRRIVLVQELPRNAMGKLQKSVLRETYRGSFTSPGHAPITAS